MVFAGGASPLLLGGFSFVFSELSTGSSLLLLVLYYLFFNYMSVFPFHRRVECLVFPFHRRVGVLSVPVSPWITPLDHRHLWINLTAASPQDIVDVVFSGSGGPTPIGCA